MWHLLDESKSDTIRAMLSVNKVLAAYVRRTSLFLIPAWVVHTIPYTCVQKYNLARKAEQLTTAVNQKCVKYFTKCYSDAVKVWQAL